MFPLKQSKEEDVMSKIFNLTGLVWGNDKLLLLISQNKNINGNTKPTYLGLLGGIANLRPFHKTDFSLSVNL